ncbi:MAG: S49 family peptidase [Rhodocyclaceae bacterium]|jgi:protease-4|nr:S49 family peptidase [Rhodocyclaceae bacterium]
MADTSENNPAWERNIIEKLALETLSEQKRRRRWGIFFKLLGFAYLTVLILVLGDWGDTAEKLGEGKKHTALVQLNGVIKPSGEASAEKVVEALQAAFKDQGTQGVILRINSPGGSPVQSGIINDEIRRLRGKHPAVPLYAVVEDVCASGGYYVAAAADRIYVDKASIVGSIGVLMDGFGFTGSMDKLGVERRLLTAGENKGFLDPFSPQDGQHKQHAQLLLDDIHKQFIEVVRKGRGKRLKESPELFSGLMWTGAKSIELGLTDELGSVEYVAREVIKAEDIRDYTMRASLTERFARQFGADMAEGLMSAFGKFGLR